MDHPPEDPHITINIVQGQHGAEFDLHELRVPVGAFTIWINQTDTSQVILPPSGQEGRVWMMRSSKTGTFRWQLQSNPNEQITMTLSS